MQYFEDQDYGKIIDPQTHDEAISAWISRSGSVHHVPSCAHEDTARIYFGCDGRTLEQRGYIHLSLFAMGYIVVRDRFRPSNAQIDAMYDLLLLARRILRSGDPYMAHNARNLRNACRMFFENYVPDMDI